MRGATALVTFLLLAAPARALLPPAAQEAVEKAAVAEAAAAHLGRRVDRVDHLRGNRYLVIFDECVVEAATMDAPSSRNAPPGPRRFRVELGPTVCQ